MSFAALQDRINATAVLRLGQSVLLGGEPVQAVFNQVHVNSNLGDFGAAATHSSLVIETAAIPAELQAWLSNGQSSAYPADTSVLVGDVYYTIVGHEPSAGLSTLVLERA